MYFILSKPSNIPKGSSKRLKLKLDISKYSNDVQPANIKFIFLTFDVSKFDKLSDDN